MVAALPRPSGAGRAHETLLAAIVLILVALFLLTGLVSRSYHARERALAKEWRAKGLASLGAGEIQLALGDFRNALTYSPDDRELQLHLAQALEAANRWDEARSYLLVLLTRAPGDGRVNLELARVAAQSDDLSGALRYYHGAIFGVWPDNPLGHRLSVRQELCQFLLERKEKAEAEAEIIALAAAIPPEAAGLHVKTGAMFLEVEDFKRALDEFRAALETRRRDEKALAGAGEAALQLGDFGEAERYFERARELHPREEHLRDSLTLARLGLELDPFERGLSWPNRGRRAARALAIALSRLKSCAAQKNESLDVRSPGTDLQQAYAQAKAARILWSERNLRRRPERIGKVMEFVFSVENLTATECGPPSGADLALWLRARKQQGIGR